MVQAPSGDGQRLIPDVLDGVARRSAERLAAASQGPDGEDREIRLTYRELSALIEEAIRSLR